MDVSKSITSKPDKYAVRFYAVVGNTGPYLFSLQDNRKGNTTGETGPDSYCRVFSTMNGAKRKFENEDSKLDSSSPSATWLLMISHLTKTYKDPSGRRILFTDNFYTRHSLADELKSITDGEVRIIGTVKFTNVDGTNRPHLRKAIEDMKDAERGTWQLLRVYNKHQDLLKLRKEHLSKMNKLPKNARTKFLPPKGETAENAGYLVWKDSKVVVFYCNCLKTTPTKEVSNHDDLHAIHVVHDLGIIQRWTGGENMHRTNIRTPAVIIAYNNFMNSVDRLDHLRSSNPTRRREKRLCMSGLHKCLCCIQGGN